MKSKSINFKNKKVIVKNVISNNVYRRKCIQNFNWKLNKQGSFHTKQSLRKTIQFPPNF